MRDATRPEQIERAEAEEDGGDSAAEEIPCLEVAGGPVGSAAGEGGSCGDAVEEQTQRPHQLIGAGPVQVLVEDEDGGEQRGDRREQLEERGGSHACQAPSPALWLTEKYASNACTTPERVYSVA